MALLVRNFLLRGSSISYNFVDSTGEAPVFLCVPVVLAFHCRERVFRRPHGLLNILFRMRSSEKRRLILRRR